MKRLVAILAAALAAFAIYTVTAPAGQQSVPSRLSSVEKKVRTLQQNLTAVKRCLSSAVPVTRYNGYVYADQNGVVQGVTTALDITEQGDQTNAILIGTRPDCVTALNLKSTRPAARRAVGR